MTEAVIFCERCGKGINLLAGETVYMCNSCKKNACKECTVKCVKCGRYICIDNSIGKYHIFRYIEREIIFVPFGEIFTPMIGYEWDIDRENNLSGKNYEGFELLIPLRDNVIRSFLEMAGLEIINKIPPLAPPHKQLQIQISGSLGGFLCDICGKNGRILLHMGTRDPEAIRKMKQIYDGYLRTMILMTQNKAEKKKSWWER